MKGERAARPRLDNDGPITEAHVCLLLTALPTVSATSAAGPGGSARAAELGINLRRTQPITADRRAERDKFPPPHGANTGRTASVSQNETSGRAGRADWAPPSVCCSHLVMSAVDPEPPIGCQFCCDAQQTSSPNVIASGSRLTHVSRSHYVEIRRNKYRRGAQPSYR